MITISSIEDIYSVFLRWLKENGIYRNYCYEFYKANKRNLLLNKMRVNVKYSNLKNVGYNILYSSSFSWSDTNEGGDFWLYKHKEWNDYCRKLIWA